MVAVDAALDFVVVLQLGVLVIRPGSLARLRDATASARRCEAMAVTLAGRHRPDFALVGVRASDSVGNTQRTPFPRHRTAGEAGYRGRARPHLGTTSEPASAVGAQCDPGTSPDAGTSPDLETYSPDAVAVVPCGGSERHNHCPGSATDSTTVTHSPPTPGEAGFEPAQGASWWYCPISSPSPGIRWRRSRN
jgi:hypothetical protein